MDWYKWRPQVASRFLKWRTFLWHVPECHSTAVPFLRFSVTRVSMFCGVFLAYRSSLVILSWAGSRHHSSGALDATLPICSYIWLLSVCWLHLMTGSPFLLKKASVSWLSWIFHWDAIHCTTTLVQICVMLYRASFSSPCSLFFLHNNMCVLLRVFFLHFLFA